MNAWVLRGLALALLHVVVRSILGFAIGEWPTNGSPLRWLSLAVVILVAGFVGTLDARRDRTRNPDPERGADLTILWLKAAVLGGFVAGILSYIVDKLPGFDLGDNSFIFELTSGAAWTILLIFIPAMAGIGTGRLLANRRLAQPQSAPAEQRIPVAVSSSGYAPDDTDAPTESFSAVEPEAGPGRHSSASDSD